MKNSIQDRCRIQDAGYRQKILPVSCIMYPESKIKKLKRAQSIIEYTMFITVVVLALLAMQIYFKRGVQGKIKDMTGYIGTDLYNPNLTTATTTTDRTVTTQSSYVSGLSTTDVTEQSTKASHQVVMPESVP